MALCLWQVQKPVTANKIRAGKEPRMVSYCNISWEYKEWGLECFLKMEVIRKLNVVNVSHMEGISTWKLIV